MNLKNLPQVNDFDPLFRQNIHFDITPQIFPKEMFEVYYEIFKLINLGMK